MIGVALPARERQPRDRADRGKRLAAEAERVDRVEVVFEFRGAVTLDGESDLVPRNAGAIIRDADQRHAACRGGDLDAARAGIDRVFDQFLDDARWPLDHFAGGDAVDGLFAKAMNGQGVGLNRTGRQARNEKGKTEV